MHNSLQLCFILLAALVWCTPMHLCMADNVNNGDTLPLSPKEFKLSLKGDDGSITVEDGSLLFRRVSNIHGTARAYLDLPVKPNSCYIFSADVKCDGGGAWACFYLGGSNGKWDEANIISGEWQTQSGPYHTQIDVGPDKNKIRICLNSFRPNSKVFYSSMKMLRAIPDTGFEIKTSSHAPELDGKFDGPFWKNARKLTPFRILNKPDELAREGSEAMLATDGEKLYIGFRFEEPDMAGINATSGPDTVDVYKDDCAEAFISGNKNSFVQLIANSAGRKYAERHIGGRNNSDWFPSDIDDTPLVWKVKTSRTANSWSCVMIVKLSDIPGSEVSGDMPVYVNFARHRIRNNIEENLTWTPILGETWFAPKRFIQARLSVPSAVTKNAKASPLNFTKQLGAPLVFMAGKPVKLELKSDRFQLPSIVIFEERGVTIDKSVKKLVQEIPGGGKPAKIKFEINARPFEGTDLSSQELAVLASPEAFSLSIGPDTVNISARTKDGVLRGIASYVLMARRTALSTADSLPQLRLCDAPRLKYRGLQSPDLDLYNVRRTERGISAYDKSVIDMAFLLRFNKILIAVDSWGGATHYPFNSADIGGSGSTKTEWQELFAYARMRGIEPIPYLSSWGRIQYITRKPEYAKFAVPKAQRQKGHTDGYRNLDVANDEAVKLMLSIQKEIIDDLKPAAMHIAFDELNFGDMAATDKARARNWKDSDWIINALNVNADFLRANKVEMHVWGDMFDPEQNGKEIDLSGPALLAKLPKDMVIYDWKYEGGDGKVDSMRLYPSLKMFSDAGFRVVGTPWFATLNVSGMARSAQKYGAEGICGTEWIGTKITQFPPELLRSLSLSSCLSWSPEDADLDQITFIPDMLFKLAMPLDKASYAVKPDSFVQSGRPESVSGESESAVEMGFAASDSLAFMNRTVYGVDGAQVVPFNENGKLTPVIVKGGSRAVGIKIPVGMKARTLRFLHATNSQPEVSGKMNANLKRFKETVPGSYKINYSDGTSTVAVLTFRQDVGDSNDSYLGIGMYPGLFGKLSGGRFFNLPVWTWRNQNPDKEIASVEILPGNSSGMDLLVFGVAVERY